MQKWLDENNGKYVINRLVTDPNAGVQPPVNVDPASTGAAIKGNPKAINEEHQCAADQEGRANSAGSLCRQFRRSCRNSASTCRRCCRRPLAAISNRNRVQSRRLPLGSRSLLNRKRLFVCEFESSPYISIIAINKHVAYDSNRVRH